MTETGRSEWDSDSGELLREQAQHAVQIAREIVASAREGRARAEQVVAASQAARAVRAEPDQPGGLPVGVSVQAVEEVPDLPPRP